MAPRDPRGQDFFFYKGARWSRTYEREFISRLADWARETHSTIKRSDIIAIRSCMEGVNYRFSTNFTGKDAQSHFKQLQLRHFVFGFIVTLPHVTYDVERNVVGADPFIWDYVTLKNPLSEAYMIQGEERWNDLCAIFGQAKAVDVFADPEVIQISSDHSNSLLNATDLEQRPLPQAIDGDPTPDLSPSFWNNLRRIVSSNDVVSQESVQNNPSHLNTLAPFSTVPLPDYDNLWSNEIDRDMFGRFEAGPTGGHTSSYGSTTATPQRVPNK